ncbi:hypothetical protein RPO42_15805, partial [Staphylococcus aureus]|nr:hypothetical protein [Staphylococcus aureus]
RFIEFFEITINRAIVFQYTETELLAIPGTPPDLLHPPKGDSFAERSQFALDIDFKTPPPWYQVSPTHFAKSWLLDERAPHVEPPEMVKK